MIPPDERARLRDCVREAWELAEQGEVPRGYEVLKLGLTWAETPAIHPVTLEQGPPEPWSGALTALYRDELLRYAALYHEALRREARELCTTAQALCDDSRRLRERVESAAQRAGVAREKGRLR